LPPPQESPTLDFFASRFSPPPFESRPNETEQNSPRIEKGSLQSFVSFGKIRKILTRRRRIALWTFLRPFRIAKKFPQRFWSFRQCVSTVWKVI
jgi:hypothetical protein